MSLNSITTKIAYNGDGATVVFDVPFKFLLNSHVVAILRASDGTETTWVEGTQYTLTGAGDENGGELTVNTSPTDYTPAAGETLTIKRAVPETQLTELPLGGTLPSTTIEQMVDLVTMMIQAHSEEIARSVLLSPTSPASGVSIPDPDAAKFLRWNTAATDLENADVEAQGSIGIPVAINKGGTNATTAAGARTNLGLVIGTDVQAFDADIPTAAASQVEMEAGTEAALRSMSPLRVAQAIAALETNTQNLVQRVYFSDDQPATGTTLFVNDDTIPQNTEADEFISGVTITPTSATNRLRIRARLNVAHSVANANVCAFLFKDDDAGAIAGAGTHVSLDDKYAQIYLDHEMLAGGTSEIEFKIRIGSNTPGTTGFNTGDPGTPARTFGGIYRSTVVVEEIVP